MPAQLSTKHRNLSIVALNVVSTLSALGPFVAGFVVSHTSSQSLFWQMLVVVLVVLAVIFKQSRNAHAP